MRSIYVGLIAALIGVLPLAAGAAITPGTNLIGTIDQTLDSSNVQVGQRFTMHNVHTQDNDIHDAVIYGHVADVIRAGQGKSAQIQLAFDKLRTASGGSYALQGRAVQVQVNTKSNALKEVGGAVAGMIVGNVLGKAIGTNAGGLLGAGGGYLFAKNNKSNVTVPQGSSVTVQVLAARRQA